MQPTLKSARLRGVSTPQPLTTQTPARSGSGTGWLRTIRRLTCWLALLLIGTGLSKAQDGSIDPTFNPTDVGFGNGDGTTSTVQSMVVQGNGKILIGGTFTTYNGTGRNYIARLNADGTLDTGFDPGTGPSSTVTSVAVQGDGKILIGGTFTTYNGTGRNYIARLNADGSLDTGFNPGTGANSNVYSMAVQGDGKILIGGTFTTYNGTGRNYIARLNADGSLDTGFNPGTGPSSNVASVAVQGDGKILIGGEFSTYNGTSRNRIARLNADGSLDTGFNPGTGANSGVQSVAVQGIARS
ncbi:delta-60 repeat domain-containing protein [Spirosoma fluviale]|uniref:delta-60 repeat domain-containing protein n=1 Tax=Spirosoma fluviale TaxID=1597977 RepID=UPI001181919B|nr:delta-60 repeat domain-containing protein [Spirosoma fluviale]